MINHILEYIKNNIFRFKDSLTDEQKSAIKSIEKEINELKKEIYSEKFASFFNKECEELDETLNDKLNRYHYLQIQVFQIKNKK